MTDDERKKEKKEKEKKRIKEIAKRITKLREDKGISNDDFYSIVTQQSFSTWNVKGVNPSLIKIYEIAKLVDTTVEYLVTGDDSSDRTQNKFELELLLGFRQLREQKDRDEVIGFINLKLKTIQEVKPGAKPTDKQSKAGKGHRAQGKGA
jgi:DNA-binding ferritin-like protein (Dps family)